MKLLKESQQITKTAEKSKLEWNASQQGNSFLTGFLTSFPSLVLCGTANAPFRGQTHLCSAQKPPLASPFTQPKSPCPCQGSSKPPIISPSVPPTALSLVRSIPATLAVPRRFFQTTKKLAPSLAFVRSLLKCHCISEGFLDHTLAQHRRHHLAWVCLPTYNIDALRRDSLGSTESRMV